MLSPVRWHEKVPRSVGANLRFRRRVYEELRGDRTLQKSMVKLCRDDLISFINLFVWQYNPLKRGERLGPFITWPFQDRLLLAKPPQGKGVLWCYEHDKTCVVEKSREMGASWLFLIVQVWLAAFHSGVQAFNISRSADAVDSKSRNSLFSKVRFILKYLPDFLKGEFEQQQFYFSFDRTSSEITGEASTGRSGSGGRASVVFVDEFSEIKEDTKVRQNTASIADCRFFNGTHLGVGTEFYNLTQSPEIVKIQVHWTRHPRKNRNLYSWDVDAGKALYWRYDEATDEVGELTGPPTGFPEDYPFVKTGGPTGGPHPGIRSPWYDQKCVDIGNDRGVAMELDINPTGAASQFYYPPTIERLKRACRDPDWVGDLTFDEDRAEPMSLTEHSEGPLSLWFHPGLDSTGKLCRVPTSTYVMGCDLGTGTGATPSCVTVFDCVLGAKVGSFTHYRKDPKQVAWLAVSLARLFRDKDGDPALLAWETPGPGVIFGNEVLKEIGYRTIYWRTDPFRDDEVVTDSPGWHANPSNKLQLHTQYASALTSGEFVNWDEPALQECLGYVHSNGTVEHPRSRPLKGQGDAAGTGTNHGDHAVADGLAWLMAKRKQVQLVRKVPTPPLGLNSILGRRLHNKRVEMDGAGLWGESV